MSILRGLVGAEESFGQRLRDERAGAVARLEIALRLKFRQSEIDGEARDSEIVGKCARSGKPYNGSVKTLGHQFVPNLAVKLLVQRFTSVAVEPNHFEGDDGVTATPSRI